MTRRLVITGATGFLGRQVLKHLVTKGLDVTLILRKSSQLPVELAEFLNPKIVYSPDVFNESKEWWCENLKDVDTLLHLAWFAKPGDYLYSDVNSQCIIGTLRMIEGARMASVRRVVGIGTCLEYEMGGDRLSVETPLKPTTPYAAAKVAIYHFASQFLKVNSIEFLWCRLFYLYGEGEDRRRLVPYIRGKLRSGEVAHLGDGSLIRDYLDVSEAARRIVLETLGEKNGSINICSGTAITIRELAQSIADEYGRRDLLKFNSRQSPFVEPKMVVGI